MAAMLRRLPDKVYEDGEWWLLFMNTKANQARYKEVSDSAMSKRTGQGGGQVHRRRHRPGRHPSG